MPTREIQLDSAAFLDSPHLAAAGVDREPARKIVEAFLSAAYDELGKAPRFLDGDDVHQLVGHLLPAHFGRRAPLAEHVPAVLRAYVEHLVESSVVTHAFEVRRALEGTLDEFARAVETGVHAHHAPAKPQKPFVHRADKVGRNDPCPCGSGRKFKQCCARLGT